MKSPLVRLSFLWHYPGWLPEIAIIRSNRIRNQVRLLALAALVGVVAGVGAIAFYVATRARGRVCTRRSRRLQCRNRGPAGNSPWRGFQRPILPFACGC